MVHATFCNIFVQHPAIATSHVSQCPVFHDFRDIFPLPKTLTGVTFFASIPYANTPSQNPLLSRGTWLGHSGYAGKNSEDEAAFWPPIKRCHCGDQ
jgi:hypothetical protein